MSNYSPQVISQEFAAKMYFDYELVFIILQALRIMIICINQSMHQSSIRTIKFTIIMYHAKILEEIT